MPTLPLIDLMILIAWTSLIVAGVQKVIGLALNTRPAILGMSPFDFVIVAGVSLLFALTLAARVWVRSHEGAAQRARREVGAPGEVLPDHPPPGAARSDGVAAGGR